MDEDIKLTSVNWQKGMLLTPEHFIQQERYLDSALMWVLRYTTNAYGLVGAGPRQSDVEGGAIQYDPIVHLDESVERGDDNTGKLSVTVSQCRGLTPSGCWIEILSNNPLRREFERVELGDVVETGVYVVLDPHVKNPLEMSARDDDNPDFPSERSNTYRLKLHVHADEAPYSIAVARLARLSAKASFEKKEGYIPACASMLAHSSLAAAWRQITEQTMALGRRYTDLHCAMQHYISLARQRGIDTENDAEVMAFASRMAIALEDCAYGLLDSSQSPLRFFGQLRRLFHGAAIYSTLSSPLRLYFEELKAQGEAEYIVLMEQQERHLQITPKWTIHADLGKEAQEALSALSALARLERALEGKYIDFRLNPMVEATNFIFDRNGNLLYRLVGRAQRTQAFGGKLTLVFAQLRLEGKSSFRLVLTTERGFTFDMNTLVSMSITINEGAGYKREPVLNTCTVSMPGQCNVEFDFEAADIPLLTDVRVTIEGNFPIHAGLLFVRQWFYATNTESRPREPLAPQPASRDTPQPEAPKPVRRRVER